MTSWDPFHSLSDSYLLRKSVVRATPDKVFVYHALRLPILEPAVYIIVNLSLPGRLYLSTR
jgi:hypothetical protein